MPALRWNGRPRKFINGHGPNARPVLGSTRRGGHCIEEFDGTRWVRQHRLVWERAHGPLAPGQIVRHRDGDKTNNELANLTVVASSDHAAWATESREGRWIEEDHGHDTPCWIWQGARTDRGYGRVKIDYISRRAHRVAWERANGAIPDGMDLHHLCGQRACINPEHLEPMVPDEHRALHGMKMS